MDFYTLKEHFSKLAEFNSNQKKYTDKKVLAVYVLKTLQMYSTEDLPLSYDDIMDYLESGVDGYKYIFSQHKKDTNRKKLQRIIQSLILAGYDIRKVKSKFWLAEEVDSILYGDTEKNAMFCFDSLVRNKYIDTTVSKLITIIESLSKFNLERITPNKIQSIILNTQEPLYLENLFNIFRYIGKRNIRFEYPSEDYNYRTYKVSPYEVIYYEDTYYLICKVYSNSRQITELSCFRVDLMEEISISKKTKFSPIESLFEDKQPTEEELSADKVFNFASIQERDVVSDYYLYQFIMKNIIGELTTVEFVATNPFEIIEKKVIDVFGDSIKLNRKTHTYTLTNVPEKKFIDWAIANYENIQITTYNVKSKVEEKLNLYSQIKRIEYETNSETSYSVALNLKHLDFNYRVFGVLESRKEKQIVIKCTKQNLSRLRAFISQTNESVVTSDISNINRNEFARMFHYKDI